MKKNYLLPILIMLTRLCFGQNVSIGDILCTDGSTVRPEQFASLGKTAEGVVFFVDSDSQQGWAVSLECQAVNTHWVTQTHYEEWYDIPMLENFEYSREAIYDLDGYRNTEIIYAQYNDSTFSARFPAFDAVDFENGWYLPTIGQLNYLYGNLIEVNAGIYAAGGIPFETGISWTYWSSTENTSQYTWALYSNGGFSNDSMTRSYRVRAARNFALDQ